jgi:hypothetical protein
LPLKTKNAQKKTGLGCGGRGKSDIPSPVKNSILILKPTHLCQDYTNPQEKMQSFFAKFAKTQNKRQGFF